MDIELKLAEHYWVLRVLIKPSYTPREAARLLGVNAAWVRAQERFLGPASSDARPVDHNALIRYVQARALKHQRVRARALLRAVLEQHLED